MQKAMNGKGRNMGKKMGKLRSRDHIYVMPENCTKKMTEPAEIYNPFFKFIRHGTAL